MRTLWAWAFTPLDRTIGDVFRLTKCTCRRWAFRHRSECPTTYIEGELAEPEQPATVQPDIPFEEPEQLELLDAEGNVADVIPIRPKLARDYVGRDWPTMHIPVIELCAACQKYPAVPGEEYCDRCDEFTHVRDATGDVVASYDDYGNRVNLT
jgi:hypothetical protein